MSKFSRKVLFIFKYYYIDEYVDSNCIRVLLVYLA